MLNEALTIFFQWGVFFSKYVFVGVVLILVTRVIINKIYDNKKLVKKIRKITKKIVFN